MYGIYLICDRCKATTIGGEQVTKNPEPPLQRNQGEELRRRAAERGWFHVLDSSYGEERRTRDLCPKCSVNTVFTPVQ